jgi:hypothetical protein
MNMVRRALQFVSIALSIIVIALPLLACLISVAEISPEQRECCKKMAGRCELSAIPSSHSCCQHPVSQQTAVASKVQRHDCGLVVAVLVEVASSLPRIISRGSATSFESPPEASPQLKTVLRI